MEKEIFDKVVEIIRDEVKQADVELTTESSSKDVDGWNSLQHVMIISAVEKAFNIKIDFMELLNIKTVGDICEVVIKSKQ